MANRADRILHLDFSPVWRGGQQQLLLLARGLRALEQPQLFVARPGPVMQRLQSEDFEVVTSGLAAWLAARHAAVVHAHDGHSHSWMLRNTALRRGWCTRVLSRRVAFAILGRASRWKYRHTDLVIAVSEQVRKQVASTGLAEERICVIADAVEAEPLPAAEAARMRLRERLRLAADTPCVSCVGAFTAEKGVGDLIAAAARMPAEVHLMLSGKGPLEATLMRQVEALGVKARVHFADCGAAECIAAGDVFAMPSREEGLGSAALLAMRLGRPVVAMRAGGIPELVRDGSSGVLVAPGDIEGLARACAALLGDRARAATLVAAGREQVESHHGSERIAAATLAAYQSVYRRIR